MLHISRSKDYLPQVSVDWPLLFTQIRHWSCMINWKNAKGLRQLYRGKNPLFNRTTSKGNDLAFNRILCI